MPKVDEDGTVEWTDAELKSLLVAEEASDALTANLGSLAVPSVGPFTCDSVEDRFKQAMESLDILVGCAVELEEWEFAYPEKENEDEIDP